MILNLILHYAIVIGMLLTQKFLLGFTWKLLGEYLTSSNSFFLPKYKPTQKVLILSNNWQLISKIIINFYGLMIDNDFKFGQYSAIAKSNESLSLLSIFKLMFSKFFPLFTKNLIKISTSTIEVNFKILKFENVNLIKMDGSGILNKNNFVKVFECFVNFLKQLSISSLKI